MPIDDSDAEIAPLDVLTAPGRLFAPADTAAALADAPDLPPVIVTEGLPPGTVLTDIGTAETLRRSLQRHLGVSPEGYRRRFAHPTSQPPVPTNH